MKERRKNNIFFKGTATIVIIFIFIAVIFPLAMWLIYHLFSYGVWYGILASFIGGALSGTATIIAIYLTLQQNNKNNTDMIELQLDLKRVDVIPFINIEVLTKEDFIKSLFSDKTDSQYDVDYTNKSPSGYFIFDNDFISFQSKLDAKYKHKLSSAVSFVPRIQEKGKIVSDIIKDNSFESTLKLTNIGLGTAINVKLDLYKDNDELIQENIEMPFNLLVNSEAYFRLVFINYTQGKYYFKFSTTDIYGKNYYYQKYSFIYKLNQFGFDNIEPPELTKKYNYKA